MADKNEKKVNIEEQKEEEVKSVKEKLNEAIDMDKVMDYVSKNVIEFDHKDKKYRVRKPTSKERQDVNQLRIQKHSSLLREKDENGEFKYMSEKDLISLYKERGINIDEMDKMIRHYRSKEKSLMIKLGKAIKDKKPETQLEPYKEEIKGFREEIQELSIKRSQLLELSIEQQMNIFVYSYFTSLLTEKKKGDKWEKVWKDFDVYLNEEDETLQNKAASNAVLVVSQNL